MNLDTLHYFEVVAEEGNLRLAAEKLHITQPALSSSIKRLEKDLNCLLFDRVKKTLVLNANGRLFYQSVKNMLSIYSEGSALIHQDPPVSGTVSIGYQIMTDSLLRFLSAFHKEHPGITVSLSKLDLTKDDIASVLYDFFVLSNPDDYGLSSVQIGGRHCLFALMRRDNPLAQHVSLSFQDLNDQRIVFTILDDGRAEPTYDYCVQAGMKPNIAYFCEDSFYQMELVYYTGAVAIVYNSFRKFRSSIENLILVPIDCDTKIATKVFLSWKAENNNAPAALMQKYARALARELPQPDTAGCPQRQRR